MALIDNAVAYYKFDSSNSNDSVGSNNGTDTSITYTTGKISNGASFNGTSSKIAFSAFSTLTTTFSINLWINFSATSGNPIFLMLGSSGTNAIYIWRNSTSGNLTFTKQGVADYDSGTVLSSSGWHMVTIVKNGDGSNNLTCYIDATATATVNSVGSIAGPTGTAHLGAFNGSSNWFNGLIDEVYIATQAFSTTDINTLYASGSPGTNEQYPFSSGSSFSARKALLGVGR